MEPQTLADLEREMRLVDAVVDWRNACHEVARAMNRATEFQLYALLDISTREVEEAYEASKRATAAYEAERGEMP